MSRDLHERRLLKWIRACKATLKKEPPDSRRVPSERRLLAALESLLTDYRTPRANGLQRDWPWLTDYARRPLTEGTADEALP